MKVLKGSVTYDEYCGHVCTCTAVRCYDDDGYPLPTSYRPTVHIDPAQSPTESGSWFYVCSRCGAGAWSGC